MTKYSARRWDRKLRVSPIEHLESRVLLAAQIYITNNAAADIDTYDTNGNALSVPLITGLPANTYAGLAVADPYVFVTNYFNGTVGEYTTSGVTVNASLITGLNAGGTGPFSVAVSGSQLFLANGDGGGAGTAGTISEYTLGSTPGTIASSNPTLITGFADPGDVVVSGTDLYFVDYAQGLVAKYNIDGTVENAALITGLSQPESVAVSGTDVFVTSYGTSTIGEYTTDGATVNAALVQNLVGPLGIAVSGSDIFVVTSSTVGEYDMTGATVNASLITGVSDGISIAISGTVASTPKLALATQPVSTTINTTLAPITVNVEDSSGAVIPADASVVNLALSGGATLGGTTSVAAVNGVATFSNLSIATAGSYIITATDAGDTSAISTAFRISVPPRSVGALDPSFASSGLAANNVGFSSTQGVATDGSQEVIIGTIGTSPNESFGITRYNADGTLDANFGAGGIITTNFSGTDDVPTSVVVLPTGQILVGGTATTFANGAAIASEFALAEYEANGSPTPGFGTGGQVLTSLSTFDVLKTLVVSPAGTIFAAGSTTATGGAGDFAIAAFSAAGAPLTSFNSNGKETLDIAGGDDVINSVALQKNGDIVAAGSTTVGGVTQVALARFLPTGALDKHFGTKGIVTTNVRGVYDSATSVVVQPKGQIVIGGVSATGSGTSISSDFLLLRCTTAGKLDRTFAGGGTVITSFDQPAAITQIVLQGDGEIVASGKTVVSLFISSQPDVAVARYTINGALDTTFNHTGKSIVSLEGASVTPLAMIAPLGASSLGSLFDQFVGSSEGVVAVTAGGEIAVAGNSGENTVEAQLVTAGVDLVTKLLTAPPAAITGGVKGTTSVQIAESGTITAVGPVTILLQVADNNLGADATTIKTSAEKINLISGKSKSYKIAFVYPQNLTSGTYYLLATVDNGTGLTDLNTDNNLAASTSTVNIAPPVIMLAGSGLTAKAPVTAGRSLSVSLTLANNGNVLAKGSVTIELLLSLSTSGGTQIASKPASVGLAAGKSKLYHLSVPIPKGYAETSYYLIAIIDPTKSLGTIDQTSSTISDPTILFFK